MTDDDIAKARATIARANSTFVTRPLSTYLVGWSAALDEVERLTKLHALAESALHSAHEATKALLALADRYFEAKEPLEVVADAARAFVAALDRDSDLVEEIRRLRSAIAGAPIPPEVAKLMADDRAEEPELPYSESVALHDAVSAVIRLARKSANPRQSLHEAVDALDAARIDLGADA